MSKLFFTGDTHFNHHKIIEYCRRPFENKNEMNEFIIQEWNRVVRDDDIVYHVGDFSNKDRKHTEYFLKRLRGKIFLCIGSHDKGMNNFRKYLSGLSESFIVNINNKESIFLSHYLHKVWPRSHYGAWHLFGHSHGGMNAYVQKEGKILDVGVDSHDFRPWSLDEVIDVMKKRPLNFNDLRRRHS